MSRAFPWTTTSLFLLLLSPTTCQQPEQFHLSLSGKPNERVVEFVTPAVGPNICFYGKTPVAPPTTPLPPSPLAPGYEYGAGYLVAGNDLFSSKLPLAGAAAWCSANSSCAGFTFASSDPDCYNCTILFKSAGEFAASPGWQTYVKPAPPILNATTNPFFFDTVGAMHTAVFTGLEPNTKYYYVCGNYTGGWGPLFSFTNGPTTWRAGIWADFGKNNDDDIDADSKCTVVHGW